FKPAPLRKAPDGFIYVDAIDRDGAAYGYDVRQLEQAVHAAAEGWGYRDTTLFASLLSAHSPWELVRKKLLRLDQGDDIPKTILRVMEQVPLSRNLRYRISNIREAAFPPVPYLDVDEVHIDQRGDNPALVPRYVRVFGRERGRWWLTHARTLEELHAR
ncbi:MAG TPA: hypothetical protein VJB16_05090, partial [archaeon]|nr:hypothetical protein [archaeon]